MFRQNIKAVLGWAFSPIDKAIIINSYGRSGSTVLTKGIITSLAGNQPRYLKNILLKSIRQQAWNLEKKPIRKGFVYKTHDYPPQNRLLANALIIYIFADPVEVVLSLLKIFNDSEDDKWMRLHFKHLKAEYVEKFYSIIDHDTLNLEKHFDCWLNETRLPIAFVRYEKLWDNQNNIAKFLGIPLELPPYKERLARQSPDPETVKRVKKTYVNLRRKVNNCDDFFTINC